MSFVEHLTGECTTVIKDPAMTFAFKPDHFQQHCFVCIERDENVLLTAHTGAGKTVVAEYGIAHHLKKNKNAIVVYTAPIKSLSNQKYGDLKAQFEKDGIKVGLLTGDNKINPDAQILVMTTEILANALYKLTPSETTKTVAVSYHDLKENFITRLKLVIFDEVHYISDKDRGRVWESAIVMLHPSVRIIALSATVDRAINFAKWIGNIKKVKTNLVSTPFRAVPLHHHIYVGNELVTIMDNTDKFDERVIDDAEKAYQKMMDARKKKTSLNNGLMIEFTKFLKQKNLLQTIFFSFSKIKCETYASLLQDSFIDHKERAEMEAIFNKKMLNYKLEYEHLDQYNTLRGLLSKGIAFHHSGLLSILKEIVEILFSKKLIKILFATETFAVGVNMPTRTVVFTELRKYTEDGERLLNTAEYKQMSGRAGRRGIDKSGTVIILPLYEFPEKSELKQVMTGKIPHITSKFDIDYPFLLKILQSSDHNIVSFMESSLFHVEYTNQIAANEQLVKTLEVDVSKFESKNNNDELMKRAKVLFDSENSEFTKLNKKQLKEFGKIKTEIGAEFYNEYCKYITKKYKLDSLRAEIQHAKTYINDYSKYMITLLHEHGYLSVNKPVSELKYSDVMIKGILASNINECNSLIMTEIVVGKLLYDLTPAEIVGLVAIFIDDVVFDKRIGVTDVEGSPAIHNRIAKVQQIVDKFVASEEKLGIEYNEEYWTLCYDYVDAAYNWASGADLATIFEWVDVYEGNFVKSMLKISNIIHDVACLCNLYNDIKILPVLEQVDKLIVRSIVTVNSLYIK